MRVGAELTREPTSRYAPIGVHGQPVSDAYVTLKAAVLRRFGPAHAACFARPDRDPRDETVGWVADVPGQPRRWSELDSVEQASRALDLEMYRADLHTYAEALRAQAEGAPGEDSAARSLAALLDQAVIVPDETHVHFIGSQPVLSFWGFRHADGRGVLGLGLVPSGAALRGPDAAASALAPALEPAVAVVQPWWRRLLWLLPLLLLLAILMFWLFWGQGCSVLPPGLLVPPDSDRALLAEPPVRPGDGVNIVPMVPGDGMAGLAGGVTVPNVGSLGGSASAAPKLPTPEVGSPPTLETPVLPDTRSPTADPPVPPQPLASPANIPPSSDTASKPGPPLEIPGDAASTGYLGFLDGQWRSRRGLVDNVTGEPLEQLYRFGPNGAGEAIVRRSDGVECRAPVRGRFVNGQLVLEEQGSLTCPDGQTYDRAVTQCTRTATGLTVCRGVNPDGTGYRVGLDKVP